ncbi:MarR family winged helix-turn-helix transcriptional regulator [Paenisporosarcina cavernae]|uniref:MarR family transcriptional regulator n=1 Tax=Paenisporosarcina cavernae TaxID=2320858 RepID=A0A385YR16_9BACL|nr:MarR family transcriptional regulator [Paenisporosarcina cavernae]AYC28437.1 MarR family transcriptional regulator [Paenisporosarcina cavernae]
MNYSKLAEELMESMIRVRKLSLNKQLDNVSFGERKILAYLHYHNNGATSGELSEKLDLTTPRVASTLKSLEKKAFIKRVQDPSDKRVVIVTVTKEGREFVKREREEAQTALSYLLQELGEEDSKDFTRIMKRIATIKESR